MGCEVHSFDPTIAHPEDLAKNVFFHRWGLIAPGQNKKLSMSALGSYGGLVKEAEMLTLQEMRARLGHTKRRIDVFKIDCEGCEWNVLAALGEKIREFDQILIEMHFDMNEMMDSDEAISNAAKFHDSLHINNYRSVAFNVNDGWEPHGPHLDALHWRGMKPLSCCREVTYVLYDRLYSFSTPSDPIPRKPAVCWYFLSSCPSQPDFVWNRGKWNFDDFALELTWNKTQCLQRSIAWNDWCGVTNSKVQFVDFLTGKKL